MNNILDIEAVSEIDIDLEKEVNLEVDVVQSGPKGKDGLSAYEVYVKNGGILTETEWLASLKGQTGEPGQNGTDGLDGYTPVKGTDYWTEEDKNEIKSYCDSLITVAIGGALNGSY